MPRICIFHLYDYQKPRYTIRRKNDRKNGAIGALAETAPESGPKGIGFGMAGTMALMEAGRRAAIDDPGCIMLLRPTDTKEAPRGIAPRQ